MSRNSTGTYTLPAGNPVTTGTTITSTWGNTTMSDLATEITDSLSRSGKGAMSAPLQAANGTVTAPGYTFDGDTNTGFYHTATADTFRAVAGGVSVLEFKADKVTALYPVEIGAGGTIDAPDFRFTSAPTTGLYLNGDVPTWVVGGAATKEAALALDGSLDLTGQGDMATTDAPGLDTLYKERLVRCWGYVGADGSGGAAVSFGHNIASVALQGTDTVRVTFATAMTDANYAVIRTATTGSTQVAATVKVTRATTYVDFDFDTDITALPANVDFLILGGS